MICSLEAFIDQCGKHWRKSVSLMKTALHCPILVCTGAKGNNGWNFFKYLYYLPGWILNMYFGLWLMTLTLCCDFSVAVHGKYFKSKIVFYFSWNYSDRRMIQDKGDSRNSKQTPHGHLIIQERAVLLYTSINIFIYSYIMSKYLQHYYISFIPVHILLRFHLSGTQLGTRK